MIRIISAWNEGSVFFFHDETVEFMMRSPTFESNNCNNAWRITWHLIVLIWPSDFYCEELKRWKGVPTHARAHTRNRGLSSPLRVRTRFRFGIWSRKLMICFLSTEESVCEAGSGLFIDYWSHRWLTACLTTFVSRKNELMKWERTETLGGLSDRSLRLVSSRSVWVAPLPPSLL